MLEAAERNQLNYQVFGPHYEERVEAMCGEDPDSSCKVMLESANLFGDEPLSTKMLKHLAQIYLTGRF